MGWRHKFNNKLPARSYDIHFAISPSNSPLEFLLLVCRSLLPVPQLTTTSRWFAAPRLSFFCHRCVDVIVRLLSRQHSSNNTLQQRLALN